MKYYGKSIYLEAASENDIRSGKTALKSSKGVKYLGETNGRQIFKLQAGKYEIIKNNFSKRK